LSGPRVQRRRVLIRVRPAEIQFTLLGKDNLMEADLYVR
jgi:hypothetical protein